MPDNSPSPCLHCQGTSPDSRGQQLAIGWSAENSRETASLLKNPSQDYTSLYRRLSDVCTTTVDAPKHAPNVDSQLINLESVESTPPPSSPWSFSNNDSNRLAHPRDNSSGANASAELVLPPSYTSLSRCECDVTNEQNVTSKRTSVHRQRPLSSTGNNIEQKKTSMQDNGPTSDVGKLYTMSEIETAL